MGQGRLVGQVSHPGRKPRLNRWCRDPSSASQGLCDLEQVVPGLRPQTRRKGSCCTRVSPSCTVSVREWGTNPHHLSKLRLSPKLQARGHLISMKCYVGNSSHAEGSLSGSLLRASLQTTLAFSHSLCKGARPGSKWFLVSGEGESV